MSLGSIGGAVGSFFGGPIGGMVGGAIGGAMDGGPTQGQSASQAQSSANPLAPYQQGWAQQLNSLMQNPWGVTQSPGYQFGMQQGTQQLQRTMQATGQHQSGAEQMAMQKFGEGYAGQQFQQQYSNLANAATGNAVAGQTAYSGAAGTLGGYQSQMAGVGAQAGSALSKIYNSGGSSGDTSGSMAQWDSTQAMSGNVSSDWGVGYGY